MLKPVKPVKKRISEALERRPTYKTDYRKWPVKPPEPHKSDGHCPPTDPFEGNRGYQTAYVRHNEPRQRLKPPDVVMQSVDPLAERTDYRNNYIEHALPAKVVKEVTEWLTNPNPLDDLSNFCKDYTHRNQDGDLITIFDSADLTYAIQCSRILRLTLFVNGQPLPLESDDIKHIRKELQTIRNRVNHLLDHLELSPSASVDECASDAASSVEGKQNVVRPQIPRSPISGKEFDPLSVQHAAGVDESAQNKVLSSFGLAADDGFQNIQQLRAGTPDSIGSTGSSNQPRPLSAQQNRNQPLQPIPQQHISPQPVQDANQYQHGQQQPQTFPDQHLMQGGYTQQSVVGAGFGQVSTGYSPGHPVAGGVPYQGQQAAFGSAADSATFAQQQRYPQGPGQPLQGQQLGAFGHSVGAVPSAPGQPSNPYSRGPSYGQYPRPHGQYPRAPQPTNYQ